MRSTAIILGCVIAFAVALHGQDRRRNDVPAPGGNATAPTAGAVTVNIAPQLMHLRFTNAVTAPMPLEDVQDIRAHLESPVLGTVSGSTRKAVVLPSDIDVNLDVKLSSADAQRTNARLHLRVMTANVDPAEGRRRFGSAEVIHDFVGWPKPGEVLIPAGATLSMPFFGGSKQMGQADLAATDPNANRADNSYPSRPILPSLLPIALDQAIDVTNIASNKLFHGQLTQDMLFQQTQTPLPAGAINLTKGTEVYVRSYEPDPSAPLGHIAIWSIDFVVVDGKRIPVKGLEERTAFTPGALAFSPDGKRKIPMVLWPLGQTRKLNIVEQQEVSSNGTTLWTYPTTPDSAPASAAPASTQSTPPPTPPPAAPVSSGSTDAQQRIEENRRRAQEIAACQQQAIKDHPVPGPELAQALAACNPRTRK